MTFLGPSDSYTLRNGVPGRADWHLIGRNEEDSSKSSNHATMEEYMTYDEIKLAELLQTSAPVKPINSGSRDNGGMVLVIVIVMALWDVEISIRLI